MAIPLQMQGQWKYQAGGSICIYAAGAGVCLSGCRLPALQMVGRAGRPQYDTEGVAVIMTQKPVGCAACLVLAALIA
jgi:hypothetical protein